MAKYWNEVTNSYIDDEPSNSEVVGMKDINRIVRPLAPSEYCQLIMAGLTEDDIKRLMKEGLIG